MLKHHACLEKCLNLYLFLFVRSVISAAVRLNILGPYEGQSVLSNTSEIVDQAYHAYHQLALDQTAVTDPFLDLFQSMHDRLYTRLFNS